MRILALEASTDACSVALFDGEAVELEHVVERRAHTRLLLPQVEAVLQRAGLRPADLDAVAFGCGPGSFTGLRLAAAVAQGLGWARDLPVLPVSSLAALAETLAQRPAVGIRPGDVVATVVDARMDEVYLNCFRCVAAADRWAPAVEALESDRLFAPAAAATALLAHASGPGALHLLGSGLRYAEIARLSDAAGCMDPDAVPDAAAVLRLAWPRLRAGERPPAREAAPVYLRDASRWQRATPST